MSTTEETIKTFETRVSGKGKAPVKDHVVREVVNALTKVAREFHNTQQLRARIAEAIEPLL
jgi:hypothetical protein